MHALIIGRTRSGKTLLARQLTEDYTRNGIYSLVLDPIGDHRWNPYFKTGDPAAFLSMAERSRSCALWVDESGEMIGHHAAELYWVATRARHLGHNSHFLCQRAAQIAPTVRDQCELLICFAISEIDARDLANDWGCPELREAPGFQQFEYLTVRRFGAATRGRVCIPDNVQILPDLPPDSEPAKTEPDANAPE